MLDGQTTDAHAALVRNHHIVGAAAKCRQVQDHIALEHHVFSRPNHTPCGIHDLHSGLGVETIHLQRHLAEGRVNPTFGEVTLQVDGFHAQARVQIMDAAGRVVWTAENMVLQGNVVLDLSALRSGTYNVMVSDERGVSVRRLTIQH